jgi:monoamine oxidase
MARSPLMHALQRIARRARARAGGAGPIRVDPSPRTADARRRFLRQGFALGAAAALPPSLWPIPVRAANAPRVVIVGAGIAGLMAAYDLRRAGIVADVFEATPRVGGRCWSERRAFADGQIAERGGELIDTEHEQLRALCAAFGLELDDLTAAELPGSESIVTLADGPYRIADIDADFARLLPALERDARALGEDLPTWRKSTPAQRALDRMSASAWIESRVPGGLASRLGRLTANAYIEELGGDLYEISAVSVVDLLRGSPRDRFSPYQESDQRYHVRGGNDQVPRLLAASLDDRIKTSHRLVALARRSDGRYRITFARDQALHDEVADRVIVAIPFTTLRQVDLDAAGFRPRKLRAIRELGMGRNAKLQLQFNGRLSQQQDANGETRVEGSFQTSWEVTRAQPGTAGILNFYSGGSTATHAGEGEAEERAREALADLERALPGVTASWNGRAIRNAWERNPWSLGSYALFKPGQYTAFNGILHEPEGHVHFAGEQTSEEWQGYLNGAVESGQRAAREVAKATFAAPRRLATP